MRYSQASRVLALLDTLAAQWEPTPIETLAEQFGISTRQLRRDLDAIEAAGQHIERSLVGGRSTVRLQERRPRTVSLTSREAYALLAVRRVFDVLHDTPLREDVESIYRKVLRSLPADVDPGEQLGDRFVYLPDGGTKVYRGKDDVINGLLTGVMQRVRVRVRYTTAKQQRRRGELEPYALALYRHGLYAVGRLHRGRPGPEPPPVHIFAVERFSRAEHIRGARFEVPAEFSPDDYFDGAFGMFRGNQQVHVVLELEPAVAYLARSRIWHPTQKVTKLPDGSARLEMDVRGTTQLTQWIVGWGPSVRVLEPQSIADEVRETHRRAAEL
ncbi:MAG: WYL domain-containing transcriptional regulator [Myxococcales bacterium]|nr:WYL domain-containing transcriptional regulator [Myxococcales bacterium]